MGIFSNLFGKKRADKVLPNPKEESLETSIDESDVRAEVSYKVDSSGDIYISCEWDNASDIPSFAELLWLVSNGNLLDETLEFIKEACTKNDDEEQYMALLYSINTIMKQHLKSLEPSKSNPLVKPTQVMAQTLDGEIA